MLIATLFLSTLATAAERPFSDLSFDAAIAAAQKDKKVVMVDFFTTWCGPCKKLDRTTWKDAKVIEWLEKNCVALKIDAEQEVTLAHRYGVKAYPTMVFVKPDGKLIDRLVGYRDAATFLADAANSIAGKTALMQAKEKLVGHENDPMARSAYAGELARAEKYEEALAEYLWCFDEGAKADESYAGVRVSFLLANIQQLGKAHPPALQALRDRRDAAEARVGAGTSTEDDVRVACAINDKLGEAERTFALYDTIKKRGPIPPNLKRTFGRKLLEPLVEARRYGEVFEFYDDPQGYVDGQIKAFESRPKPSDDADPQMRKTLEDAEPGLRQHVAKRAAVMFEALVGAQRHDAAAKAADALIAFSNTGETYAALVDRAARAGDVAYAKTLAERGLAALPEDEKSAVRAAQERIASGK